MGKHKDQTFIQDCATEFLQNFENDNSGKDISCTKKIKVSQSEGQFAKDKVIATTSNEEYAQKIDQTNIQRRRERKKVIKRKWGCS